MTRRRHGFAQTGNARLIALAVASAAAFAYFGATASAGEGAIERVVAAIPAGDDAAREALRRDVAQLSQADIHQLCALLVEPGAGDDTKPRLALHAAAVVAGGPGGAALRAGVVAAIAEQISANANRSPGVRAFLLEQLALVGSPDALAAIAPLLGDSALCADAVHAALSAGPAARETLLAALPSAEGSCRLALLDALAALRDERIVPELLKGMASADRSTRQVCFRALAVVAEARAGDALVRAAQTDNWFDRNEYVADCFLLAARLFREGQTQSAAELLRLALQRGPRDPESDDVRDAHLQCARLRLLADGMGIAALDDLLPGLTSSEPDVSTTAFELLAEMHDDGVTSELTKRLTTSDAALRGRIFNVFAARGDSAGLAPALGALRDADAGVRVAALDAAAATGGAAAVDPLADHLANCPPAEQEWVSAALAGIRDAAADEKIAKRLSAAPQSPASAVLAAALARRGAEAQAGAVLAALAASRDESVRVACGAAMGRLGSISHAPGLVEQLAAASTDAQREAIESALSLICLRAGGEAGAAPLLAALNPDLPESYCALVRVLAKLGGEGSLVAVRRALKDERDDVRESALKALADWPDDALVEFTLEYAQNAPELKQHVLALRAYAAQLSRSKPGTPASDVLRAYVAGLSCARRVEEMRLFVSLMADVRDPQAIAFLRPRLSDERIRTDAAVGILHAAEKLLPAGWNEARQAIVLVEAASDDPAVRAAIERLRPRIAEFDGFLTDWLVAGPYEERGRNGPELFDVAFPPERAGTDVAWKPKPRNPDAGAFWLLDLNADFAGANRAGYLKTRIFSPQAQPARLELGSDDGIKVWLNGKVIHANNASRGLERNQDRVDVQLRSGWNDLLLKVTNGGGGWAACARLRGPGEAPLDGIRIDPNGKE